MYKRTDRTENPILPTTEQRATMLQNGFATCSFGGFVDCNGHRAYRSDRCGRVLFIQIMHCNYTGRASHSRTHYFNSWEEMISTCMVEFSK